MKQYTLKPTQWLFQIIGLAILLSASTAYADETSETQAAPLKQFVVVLDKASGEKLAASQVAASKSESKDNLESMHSVSLREEFQSDELAYGVLTAKDEEKLTEYLSALELTPVSMIETEFTLGPSLGGGEVVSETPKDGHNIYVIERAIPDVSGLPLEKMKEVSKGSQSVVAQFGDAMEWDRSYMTQKGTFCVYRTDDEKNIKEHGKIAGFPVDKITLVKHVTHKFEF